MVPAKARGADWTLHLDDLYGHSSVDLWLVPDNLSFQNPRVFQEQGKVSLYEPALPCSSCDRLHNVPHWCVVLLLSPDVVLYVTRAWRKTSGLGIVQCHFNHRNCLFICVLNATFVHPARLEQPAAEDSRKHCCQEANCVAHQAQQSLLPRDKRRGQQA